MVSVTRKQNRPLSVREFLEAWKKFRSLRPGMPGYDELLWVTMESSEWAQRRPSNLMQFIKLAMEDLIDDQELEMLATGPIEELLGYDYEASIEQIMKIAKKTPALWRLLPHLHVDERHRAQYDSLFK